MAQTEFKRYEYKYIIDDITYYKLLAKLENFMDYDIFCKDNKPYEIFNIYFDTKDDDVIKKSLSHPYYKEKLRLRSYNQSGDDDLVFLELKKKIDGVVSKRRIIVTLADSKKVLDGSLNVNLIEGSTNALYEITNYINRYELFAKLAISYQRLALFAKDGSGFRVSFDTNIRTNREKLGLENTQNSNLLLRNKILMEAKIKGPLPIWFVHILSELNIKRTSFSKYGNEYMTYTSNKKVNEIKVAKVKERREDEQFIYLTS